VGARSAGGGASSCGEARTDSAKAKIKAATHVTDPGKAALQTIKVGDVIVTVFSVQTAIKVTVIR
jgi:hypothetical protein